MQSTTVTKNRMLITGGRNELGEMLSDLWMLQIFQKEEDTPLQPIWTPLTTFSLPLPTCAHSALLLLHPIPQTIPSSSSSSPTALTSSSSDYRLVLYGGFTSQGIASDILVLPWSLLIQPEEEATTNNNAWQHIPIASIVSTTHQQNNQNGHQSSPNQLQGRFGQVMTSLSRESMSHLLSNPRYVPLFQRGLSSTPAVVTEGTGEGEGNHSNNNSTISNNSSMALLFGGVNVEQDFADLWILTIH